MSRTSALRTQTLACLQDICGGNFGPNLDSYHRHPELSERLRKIMIASATETSDKEALESLASIKPIADFPLAANFSDSGQTIATFDAFTGYLDTLPNAAPSPLAVRAQTRKLSLLYPQILGSESSDLSQMLANRLEIVLRPTRAEAIAKITASLSTLENWRGSELEKNLQLLGTLIESVQIMIPFSDGLAFDSDATFYLSPSTLNSPRAVAVALHETAHVISVFAAKHPRSPVATALRQIKSRLAKLNPVPGEKYVEEDWADFFSAKLSGENMACDFVSAAVKSDNLGFIPKDSGDDHSAIVFRVLAIERAAHGSLPKSCLTATEMAGL